MKKEKRLGGTVKRRGKERVEREVCIVIHKPLLSVMFNEDTMIKNKLSG
jgi:hypothetical protein